MNSKKGKSRKTVGGNEDQNDIENHELLLDAGGLEEFDTSGKNKSKKSNILKQVDIQMKTLGSGSDSNSSISQSDTQKQKIDFEQRLGTKIPFTGVPFCHFKAMLKKEHIVWKRNFKRSLLEILLPIIVCIILSVIRLNIHPK